MPPKSKTTPLAEKLGKDRFFGTSPDLPRVLEIDLAKLRPNPDQPRTEFNEDSIQELAASIKQHGLIQPIAIAKDPENPESFIVIAGGRRYYAFQQLGRETIPAIMTTGAPDEIALIENIQRENLHPLDEARALANLMQRHGYTQEEVSKVVGKARRTVGELLGLMVLPQKIQDEWRTSAIPKSTLIEISRVDMEEEQFALWERVRHGDLTVREARATKKGSSAPRVRKHPAEKALEAGRGFVQSLQKVTDGGALPEKHMLSELHVLRKQIDALLKQLAEGAEDTVESS